jgi:hypothetical protein
MIKKAFSTIIKVVNSHMQKSILILFIVICCNVDSWAQLKTEFKVSNEPDLHHLVRQPLSTILNPPIVLLLPNTN